MSRRPSWGGNLEQRTAAMREMATATSGDNSGQAGHTFPKHVWVNVTGRSTDRSPGVLIDWRKDGAQWWALVTWVEGGGMRAPHAHTAWVRAEHVKPA
jgi:hypothetical protein